MDRKYHLISAAILLTIVCGWQNAIAQRADEAEARKVAEAFMNLVNSGKYAEAWEQVSEQFKPISHKPQFIEFYRSSHKRYGRAVSRKLVNTETQHYSLDGPVLEGITFTYKSMFRRNKAIDETIGVFLERDGKWHVGAYFIEPWHGIERWPKGA